MSKTRTIFKKDVCFYKKINSNSQMLAVTNCWDENIVIL